MLEFMKRKDRPEYIEADNATDIFEKACKNIMTYGSTYKPRNLKIIELRNVTLKLTNPENNIVNTKERKISLKYLLAEWFWYVSGDTSVNFIGKYAPFWRQITNPDGTLNSNYGYYMFKQPLNEHDSSYSQFDYVVNTLTNDKDSRQAVVNVNNVSHKVFGIKDFPCTVFMQFFIRNNALEMTVCMRSTDLVLGYCNDVFQFTLFQYLVYNKLKNRYLDLKMGNFTLFTSSLHIYEKHFNMAREVMASNRKRSPRKDDINLSTLYSVNGLTYEYFCEKMKSESIDKIIEELLKFKRLGK